MTVTRSLRALSQCHWQATSLSSSLSDSAVAAEFPQLRGYHWQPECQYTHWQAQAQAREIREQAKRSAEKDARKIVAMAVQRISAEQTAETTVAAVRPALAPARTDLANSAQFNTFMRLSALA